MAPWVAIAVTLCYRTGMDKRATYNFPLLGVAIDHLGGRTAAARKLGCSRQAVTHLFTGRNGLSTGMARGIEKQTARRYLAADLLGLTTTPDKAA